AADNVLLVCKLRTALKHPTHGKHEAQAIISDIESQAYRNRLAKIFSTDLAVAPNKASKISAKSYSMILNLRARCIKVPS
uniref:Uncharacterized protein n=1 Tax=Aegilops tauschii subsp. strangulata TaxID=200361 RepID=A0A453L0Z7_AEGTS